MGGRPRSLRHIAQLRTAVSRCVVRRVDLSPRTTSSSNAARCQRLVFTRRRTSPVVRAVLWSSTTLNTLSGPKFSERKGPADHGFFGAKLINTPGKILGAAGYCPTSWPRFASLSFRILMRSNNAERGSRISISVGYLTGPVPTTWG